MTTFFNVSSCETRAILNRVGFNMAITLLSPFSSDSVVRLTPIHEDRAASHDKLAASYLVFFHQHYCGVGPYDIGETKEMGRFHRIEYSKAVFWAMANSRAIPTTLEMHLSKVVP